MPEALLPSEPTPEPPGQLPPKPPPPPPPPTLRRPPLAVYICAGLTLAAILGAVYAALR